MFVCNYSVYHDRHAIRIFLFGFRVIKFKYNKMKCLSLCHTDINSSELDVFQTVYN
jgi:hypothetical protein